MVDTFKASHVWDGEKWINCDKEIDTIENKKEDIHYTENYILVFGKNKNDDKIGLYKCSQTITVYEGTIEGK